MQIPIYETDNFYIQAARNPFIDRSEGGHLYVFPKVSVRDRTLLSPSLAIEYMKLTMVAGEALVSAMARRGVDIGIVNYQDMGNWKVFTPEGPSCHTHIYGRAKTATIQKYGEAVQLPRKDTGFYDTFLPFDTDDIREIETDIQKLLKSDKYSPKWHEE